jgi:hypothetical protein
MEVSPIEVIKHFYVGKTVKIECALKLSDSEFKNVNDNCPSKIYRFYNRYHDLEKRVWSRIEQVKYGEPFFMNVFYLGFLDLKIYGVKQKASKFIFEIEQIGEIEVSSNEHLEINSALPPCSNA